MEYLIIQPWDPHTHRTTNNVPLFAIHTFTSRFTIHQTTCYNLHANYPIRIYLTAGWAYLALPSHIVESLTQCAVNWAVCSTQHVFVFAFTAVTTITVLLAVLYLFRDAGATCQYVVICALGALEGGREGDAADCLWTLIDRI